MIRDKTNVIKNYLNEIKEEENSTSFTISRNNNSFNETIETEADIKIVEPPITPNSKPITPKSLPNLTQQALLTAALKTPTEEALAFIEKAKIQIKKQNSLINENGVDHVSTSSPPLPTTSPQHKLLQQQKQDRSINNHKIQNLLNELSLDEPYEETELNANREQNVENQSRSEQTFNNESDNSTQLLDVDRYRIDFTSNDDDNFDILNFNSSSKPAANKFSNVTSTANEHHHASPTRTKVVKEAKNGVNGEHNYNHDEDYNSFMEREKSYIERIEFLQEENSKFRFE